MNEVAKLTPANLFTYTLFFCALILPGFEIIHFYFPSLIELEFSKLLLFSILYSLPILLISIMVFILVLATGQGRIDDDQLFSGVMTLGSLFTLISTGISALLIFLINIEVIKNHPVVWSYVFSLSIFILMIFAGYLFKRAKGR